MTIKTGCSPCFQTYFINPFDVTLMANPKKALLITMIPIISFIIIFISGTREPGYRINSIVRGIVTLLSFGVLTLFLDLIVFLGKKLNNCYNLSIYGYKI